MKNLEKYKDYLIKAIALYNSDELLELAGIDCNMDYYGTKKSLVDWLLQDYKEPILDDAERKYLTAVIKPFREKIEYIRKNESAYKDKQFISIGLYDGDGMHFPYLDDDSMYKGMELDKKYSLEELGL